jgi:hypothetical protein
VEDRPQVDVDRLQRAERPFDLGERFIGADGGGIVERRFGQIGAHHVDAIESGLGRDGIGVATEREARLADIEFEVFGHLVPVDDGAVRASRSAQSRVRTSVVLRNGRVQRDHPRNLRALRPGTV